VFRSVSLDYESSSGFVWLLSNRLTRIHLSTKASHSEWVASWLSGNGVGHIHEVILRQARLVLRWATVHGYTSPTLNMVSCDEHNCTRYRDPSLVSGTLTVNILVHRVGPGWGRIGPAPLGTRRSNLVLVFRQPFVKPFALCYRAVVSPVLSVMCALSVSK